MRNMTSKNKYILGTSCVWDMYWNIYPMLVFVTTRSIDGVMELNLMVIIPMC